jgi:hypothetical protein
VRSFSQPASLYIESKLVQHVSPVTIRAASNCSFSSLSELIFSRHSLFNLNLSFLKTLSCFEVLWIRLSICFVHLQSLLKIMPKCLCLFTELRTIPSKSKLSSSCWFLILHIIISVLLGLNFANQVSPHFFVLFRSILIIFF